LYHKNFLLSPKCSSLTVTSTLAKQKQFIFG
jgi:hypothetical protein